MEGLLVNRKNNYKIDSWDVLWQTLFPGHDTNIPSREFVPPIELDEVEDYFQRNTTVLAGTLELAFGRGVTANRANGILRQFMDGVFQQCRERLPTTETTPVNTRRPKLPLARSAPEALRQHEPDGFHQLGPETHNVHLRPRVAIPAQARNTSELTYDTPSSSFFQGSSELTGPIQPFSSGSLPNLESIKARFMEELMSMLPRTMGPLDPVQSQPQGPDTSQSHFGGSFNSELNMSHFQFSQGSSSTGFHPVGLGFGHPQALISTHHPPTSQEQTDMLRVELHQLRSAPDHTAMPILAHLQPNFTMAPGHPTNSMPPPLEVGSDKSSGTWEKVTADGQDSNPLGTLNPKDLVKGG